MKRTAALCLVLAIGCDDSTTTGKPDLSGSVDGGGAKGINLIQHIIIIMQENRSFDHYFGTFPGAEGIPMGPDGTPSVCIPDPALGACKKPYLSMTDVDSGGPHGASPAIADIDGGKMDGFIIQQQSGKKSCTDPQNPNCAGGTSDDAVSYHDDSTLANYWAYAKAFVLQDHMFEPAASWSLPSHLFLVSEWSAICDGGVESCHTNLNLSIKDAPKYDYAWTDLTYLLHKNGIRWKYYLAEGTEPDCADDAADCPPVAQLATVPSIWNPLPGFRTVKQDNETGNIVELNQLYLDAKNGQLPQVAWVIPDQDVSEHPPALVSIGQHYVTGLINTIMKSPEWSSTAIFLAWDDWGGFYDHVVPPVVDGNGYGLRVPGLLISPYAKTGYIDKQVLSFDAYAKFIEDRFLGGQRLDPKTDGRPDPRPTVREALPALGDLTEEFDFTQPPRPPMLLMP